MIRERAYNGLPGLPVLLVILLAEAASVWMLVMNIRTQSAPEIVVAALAIAVLTFLTAGPVHGQPERGQGAAAVRRIQGHRQGRRACDGRIPFWPRRKCRCAFATSRART